MDEPLDTPVMRPYIQEFLDTVCLYFQTVRVCTLSLKARAREIVELLDPHSRHLLRDGSEDGRPVCLEDWREGMFV